MTSGDGERLAGGRVMEDNGCLGVVLTVIGPDGEGV